MKNKILTILIPVYKTEQYLPKCLDSLINSNYIDLLDIVVVSDGSPDNSLSIASKYKERFPDSFNIIDKENGGHGSTINCGILEAKGKYFRVLDSDDWFNTGEFDKYLEKLLTTDCDVVLTDTTKVFVYDNNRTEIVPNVDFLPNSVLDVESIDYSNITGDNFLTMSKVTYSTIILRQSGLKLFEKCFYVDVQYALFVYKYVRSVIYYDNNVYQYFIGRPEQSVSTNGYRSHYQDFSRVMFSCASYIKQNVFDLNSNKDKWLYNSLLQKIRSNYLYARYLDFETGKNALKLFTDQIKKIGLYDEVCSDIRIRLYKACPFLFLFGMKLLDKFHSKF